MTHDSAIILCNIGFSHYITWHMIQPLYYVIYNLVIILHGI